MGRLFEPGNKTNTREFAIQIRRAAITQIKACDEVLGWQTEVIRVTENEQNKVSEKAGKRNSR